MLILVLEFIHFHLIYLCLLRQKLHTLVCLTQLPFFLSYPLNQKRKAIFDAFDFGQQEFIAILLLLYPEQFQKFNIAVCIFSALLPLSQRNLQLFDYSVQNSTFSELYLQKFTHIKQTLSINLHVINKWCIAFIDCFVWRKNYIFGGLI